MPALHAAVAINLNATASCMNADWLRTYDSQGRLTSAAANGQTRISVEYDASGLVSIARVGDANEKRFIRDHSGAVVAVTTTADTVATLLDGLDFRDGELAYYSTALGNRIARRTSSDISWFVHDHLGSTRAEIDGQFTLTRATRMLPFGGEWESSGAPVPDPYGYEGRRDEVPGLLDFGARHYQPTRGVFLQPDTVVPDYGNPQSLNRNAFELNSPLTHTDPTGHFAVAAGSAAAVGGSGLWTTLTGLAAGMTPVGWVIVATVGASVVTVWALDRVSKDGGDGEEKGAQPNVSPDDQSATPGGPGDPDGKDGGGEDDPGIKFNSHAEKRMRQRGWTKADVVDAIRNPKKVVKGLRDTRRMKGGQNMNDPAAAYYSRGGGYVVRNLRTGDIVQITTRTGRAWRAWKTQLPKW